MQDCVSHRQSDPSEIPAKHDVSPRNTANGPVKCHGGALSGNPKAKSRRIIFRVPVKLYEALMARSRDVGCDLSHVVRSGLDGSLKSETATNAPQKPILRTAEIDQLVDHYRSVVSEDIRHVRRRLFGHLLAASYVTKMNFPRTPGSVDGYQALLKLQHLFGYGENG
jgi:hypothetical protein